MTAGWTPRLERYTWAAAGLVALALGMWLVYSGWCVSGIGSAIDAASDDDSAAEEETP